MRRPQPAETNVSDTSADKAQYQRARDEFDKLGAEDKAAFVIETAFASVGELVATLSRKVSDAVEEAMNDLRDEPSWPPPPNDVMPPPDPTPSADA